MSHTQNTIDNTICKQTAMGIYILIAQGKPLRNFWLRRGALTIIRANPNWCFLISLVHWPSRIGRKRNLSLNLGVTICSFALRYWKRQNTQHYSQWRERFCMRLLKLRHSSLRTFVTTIIQNSNRWGSPKNIMILLSYGITKLKSR